MYPTCTSCDTVKHKVGRSALLTAVCMCMYTRHCQTVTALAGLCKCRGLRLHRFRVTKNSKKLEFSSLTTSHCNYTLPQDIPGGNYT